MLRAILTGVTAMVMAVMMPMVLLSPQDHKQEDKVLIMEVPSQQERTVSIQGVDMPLEEYLVGVVLSEMPMSFELEALKAQAVAARTFAMRQMEGGKHTDFDLCGNATCCQAWTSPEAMEQKLGNEYLEKAKQAVNATKGQVMTYEGKLIDAVYFSCSGGQTEDAVAVWGGQVPYLRSVKSPGEETASKYRSVVNVPMAQFRAALPEATLTGNPSSWFGGITRTNGGGVSEMVIGGQPYTGTDLRSRFHLNSTMFEIAIGSDEITFEVQGYGHRVGMSQYGANAMAKDGKKYREILAHYYTGVVIS